MKHKLLTYNSPIGNIDINVIYKVFEDGTVMMDSCYYEQEYIKLFINLLVKSIDDLLIRKYKIFIQKVTLNDWNEFLKLNEKWTIVKIDNITETVDISCPLDKAVENICEGFGINYKV